MGLKRINFLLQFNAATFAPYMGLKSDVAEDYQKADRFAPYMGLKRELFC